MPLPIAILDRITWLRAARLRASGYIMDDISPTMYVVVSFSESNLLREVARFVDLTLESVVHCSGCEIYFLFSSDHCHRLNPFQISGTTSVIRVSNILYITRRISTCASQIF